MPHDRRTKLRRVAALVACGVAAGVPLAGCATVARVVTAIDTASRIGDILSSVAPSDAPGPPGSRTGTVQAVVTGTHGAGLRLEQRPGHGRLSVWPDGSAVTIDCATAGPRVYGPRGATAGWSHVATADGTRGFMSDAYLEIIADHGSVAPC